jgi:hypothetical protein
VKNRHAEKIDNENKSILIIVNIYLKCTEIKVNNVNEIIEKENKKNFW